LCAKLNLQKEVPTGDLLVSSIEEAKETQKRPKRDPKETQKRPNRDPKETNLQTELPTNDLS
jgi:hypothetical protein